MKLIAFEFASSWSKIEEKAFPITDLKFVGVPPSTEVLGVECFSLCKLLSSVTFESRSKLSRIEKSAFYETGLIEIIIPASIEVLGESCFSRRRSLSSITFESGSRLSRQSRMSHFLIQFRSPDPPIALFSIPRIHQSIKKFDHGRPTWDFLSSIMLCDHPRSSPNIDFFTASRSGRRSQSSPRFDEVPNVDPVKAMNLLVNSWVPPRFPEFSAHFVPIGRASFSPPIGAKRR
jgi:hypothetical protein